MVLGPGSKEGLPLMEGGGGAGPGQGGVGSRVLRVDPVSSWATHAPDCPPRLSSLPLWLLSLVVTLGAWGQGWAV